jgi:uncharacterized protein
MGMDWHSSGITTSVIGALKRGLGPLEKELGIHVCGGRGKHSRNTPQELVSIGARVWFDGTALARASCLVAKVDSAAVQDGFELYLHGFIVTDDGRWVAVQQGMKGARKQARRYHWLSEGLDNFVDQPHSAIEGESRGHIVNLTDRRAKPSRARQLDLLGSIGPDGIVRELAALENKTDQKSPTQLALPHLVMPAHHDVRASDGRLEHANGLIVDADGNRERMPVLAAMRERETRRIGEAVRSPMHQLGDHCQCAHRAGAHTWRQHPSVPGQLPLPMRRGAVA